MKIKRELSKYLSKARVARLGTENEDGSVHLVPVVFAHDQDNIYFVIDRKPKGRSLRRIENIERAGRATLLVDTYSENWRKLSFVLIYCGAKILRPYENIREKKRASVLLRRKYNQYRDGRYFPQDVASAVFVALRPKRYAEWQHFLRRNES